MPYQIHGTRSSSFLEESSCERRPRIKHVSRDQSSVISLMQNKTPTLNINNTTNNNGNGTGNSSASSLVQTNKLKLFDDNETQKSFYHYLKLINQDMCSKLNWKMFLPTMNTNYSSTKLNNSTTTTTTTTSTRNVNKLSTSNSSKSLYAKSYVTSKLDRARPSISKRFSNDCSLDQTTNPTHLNKLKLEQKNKACNLRSKMFDQKRNLIEKRIVSRGPTVSASTSINNLNDINNNKNSKEEPTRASSIRQTTSLIKKIKNKILKYKKTSTNNSKTKKFLLKTNLKRNLTNGGRVSRLKYKNLIFSSSIYYRQQQTKRKIKRKKFYFSSTAKSQKSQKQIQIKKNKSSNESSPFDFLSNKTKKSSSLTLSSSSSSSLSWPSSRVSENNYFDWSNYFEKNHKISSNQNFRLSTSWLGGCNLSSAFASSSALSPSFSLLNDSFLFSHNTNHGHGNLNKKKFKFLNSNKSTSSLHPTHFIYNQTINNFNQIAQNYSTSTDTVKSERVKFKEISRNLSSNLNLTKRVETKQSNDNDLANSGERGRRRGVGGGDGDLDEQRIKINNENDRKSIEEKDSIESWLSVGLKANFDSNAIWKNGFTIISDEPICLKSACFLCGSAGLESNSLIYCNVCCEGFHEFCVERSDLNKSEKNQFDWICPICKYCTICKDQNNLISCQICENSYHPGCIKKKDYPKKTFKNNKWTCFNCFKCKNCDENETFYDKKLHSKLKEFDFSVCFKCFKLTSLGLICVECDKTLETENLESKTELRKHRIIKCEKCLKYFHSKCFNILEKDFELICDETKFDSINETPIKFNCNSCDKNRSWKNDLNSFKLNCVNCLINEMSEIEPLLLDDEFLLKLKEKIKLIIQQFDLFDLILKMNEEIKVHLADNYCKFQEKFNEIINEKYLFISALFNKSPECDKLANTNESNRKKDKFNESKLFSIKQKSFALADLVKIPYEDHNYIISSYFPIESIQSTDIFCSMDAFYKFKNKPEKCSANENNEIFKIKPFSNLIENKDNRKCYSCGIQSDHQICGRLLPFDKYWIHTNCLLWSNEIHVEKELIKNIENFLKKSKSCMCKICQKPGASLMCNQKNCNTYFHFYCAYTKHLITTESLNEKHKFFNEINLFKSKELNLNNKRRIFCQNHSNHQTKSNENLDKFLLSQKRKLLIEQKENIQEEIKTIIPNKNKLKLTVDKNLHLLSGSLQINNFGTLLDPNIKNNNEILCPINFSSSRLYWSTKEIGKLVLYECRIKQIETEQQFSNSNITSDDLNGTSLLAENCEESKFLNSSDIVHQLEHISDSNKLIQEKISNLKEEMDIEMDDTQFIRSQIDGLNDDAKIDECASISINNNNNHNTVNNPFNKQITNQQITNKNENLNDISSNLNRKVTIIKNFSNFSIDKKKDSHDLKISVNPLIMNHHHNHNHNHNNHNNHQHQNSNSNNVSSFLTKKKFDLFENKFNSHHILNNLNKPKILKVIPNLKSFNGLSPITINDKLNGIKIEPYENLKCSTNVINETTSFQFGYNNYNSKTAESNILFNNFQQNNKSFEIVNFANSNNSNNNNNNNFSPKSDTSDSSLNLTCSSSILNPFPSFCANSNFNDTFATSGNKQFLSSSNSAPPKTSKTINNSSSSSHFSNDQTNLKKSFKPKIKNKSNENSAKSVSNKATIAAILSATSKYNTTTNSTQLSQQTTSTITTSTSASISNQITHIKVETNLTNIKNSKAETSLNFSHKTQIETNNLNNQKDQEKLNRKPKPSNKLRDYFKSSETTSVCAAETTDMIQIKSNELVSFQSVEVVVLEQPEKSKIIKSESNTINKKEMNKMANSSKKEMKISQLLGIYDKSCSNETKSLNDLNYLNKTNLICNEKTTKYFEKNENSNTSNKIIYEIISEDGFYYKSTDINDCWNAVTFHVHKLRINNHLKNISFKSIQGVKMFGLNKKILKFLLSKIYSFDLDVSTNNKNDENINETFKNENLKTKNSLIGLNARTNNLFTKTKTNRDPFYWLLSETRNISMNRLFDQNFQQAQRTLLTTDLPNSIKYRFLKQFSKAALVVKQSTIHGRGLFTLVDLIQSQMVIEYSGEIVRHQICDRREKYYESKGIGCYMFEIDEFEVVDATKYGNQARFINHSCEPNCISKILLIEGKKHIIIFAQRTIQKDEELTYDYKFPKEEDKINCLCKSSKCKKYLN